jgi:hypothetical protein
MESVSYANASSATSGTCTASDELIAGATARSTSVTVLVPRILRVNEVRSESRTTAVIAAAAVATAMLPSRLFANGSADWAITPIIAPVIARLDV